jgi:PPP family 3-phenylpropionic acid transporter
MALMGTGLTPFIAFFATLYMAIAAFTFIAVVLFARGLSPSQTGLLLSLLPVVQVMVQPLWGVAADTTGRTKTLLVGACGGLLAGALGLWMASRLVWLIAAVVLVAVSRAGILPLVTTLALDHLGPRGRGFGRIRLWGSLGFSLMVLATGWMAAGAEPHAVLLVHALCVLAAALVALTLPPSPSRPPTVRTGGYRPALVPGLGRAVAAAVLAGTGLGVNNTFLAVFVRDLGGPAWTLGAAFAIAALGEIPLMAAMHRLIVQVGTARLVSAGLLALAVRWSLYAVLPSVWPLLPLQLLHSVAIACLEVAGVLLVRDLSPPGWAATAQATYGAALMGLGPGIGTMLAGVVYEAAGPRAVFAASAVPALAGWTLFTLGGGRRGREAAR